MQCCEFEMLLTYMTKKLAEFEPSHSFDRLDLADILSEHSVTTIDRMADVVSLARNLQSEVRLLAA